MTEGAHVPDGCAARIMPETEVAVNWFRYLDDDDIWSIAHSGTERWMAENHRVGCDGAAGWCGEWYPINSPAASNDGILGYCIACRSA